jgi:hypothetical protein
MVHNQATNFRTLATQFVPGSIALALATSALFGLHLDLASTAFAYSIASRRSSSTSWQPSVVTSPLSATSKENDSI